MSTPMLADFAIRLAGGLAFLLLVTDWRLVPIGFFKTHCLVMLGLLVLASLDLGRSGSGTLPVAIAVTAAVLSYAGTATWGLGLPTVARPITGLIVLACALGLGVLSTGATPSIWFLNWSGRLASAFVLGATLTAMLLGHYYLTAPAMSIDPLKRFVRAMAWGLGLRAACGLIGWLMLRSGEVPSANTDDLSTLFLAVRWGMGFGGPALATFLSWKTVLIRSTQSATGILYIAMTLLLFGELTALILSRTSGVIL